jgi:hypothetical protein
VKRAISVGIVSVLAACVAKEPVSLPAIGVHRSVIALAVEPSGALTAHAASLEDGLDLPFHVESEDTQLYLLYFRSGIDELGFAPGTITLSSGLGCGRTLPAANETYRSTAANRVFEPVTLPEQLAALRVPADFSTCPQLGALEADLRCGNPHCFGALRQEGCEAIFDLAACGRGELRFPIDRSGSICIEENALFGACMSVPSRDAEIFQTQSCGTGELGTCEIEVYRAENAAQVIGTETVRLVDVAPLVAPDYERPPGGYLTDLVILDDRVVVAANATSVAAFCTLTRAGTAYFLDLGTMQTTGTATIPPCLGNLRRDPLGDGFVGTFRENNRPALGRFTKDARLIASVISTEEDPRALFANSLAIDTALGPIAGAINKTASEHGGSYLLAVDLRTMEILPISGPLATNTFEIQSFSPGKFSALEDQQNYIMMIDLESGRRDRVASTALVRGGLGMMLQAQVDQRSFLVISMLGPAGGVISYNLDGEIAGRARPHRALSETWSIAAWPDPDTNLVLAAFSEAEGEQRGYLGLVDIVAARFLLGEVQVGSGPGAVGRFHLDEQQRLWAVMPWTAEVLRVHVR